MKWRSLQHGMGHLGLPILCIISSSEAYNHGIKSDAQKDARRLCLSLCLKKPTDV